MPPNLTLTLIGGPTVLIGLRILTDPTFDPPGEYQGAHSPVVHKKVSGSAIAVEGDRSARRGPAHALDFMLARLDGDPTIWQLAQECGLSPGYFARAFRPTTGAAPHQWLMRKRIERARELLLTGTLDLADVAPACGFVDQSHFTRVFAKHQGAAPGQWRRMNRARSTK